MKIYKINNNFNEEDLLRFSELNKNSTAADVEISQKVKEIITKVRQNGDEELIKLCNEFDKTNFNNTSDFIVSADEVNSAQELISNELKNSLKIAFDRIKSYHQKQLPQDLNYQDDIGVELGNKWQAIEKIAVYAPGGSAAYPSSVLMSAIPALIAGAKEINLFTPATNNKINPAIIYCAKLCNIKNIYKIGGAQAIAAACYGTKTIAKVDKIVGPGNAFVAAAKKEVFGDVGIDMIAGPTDLTIIAQSNIAKAPWVAVDALSQLEHGADSKSFIITDSNDFAQDILKNIETLQKKLSRQNIISSSLRNSAIFVVSDISQATKISNFIAPEHLEIISDDYKNIVKNITNAGAIFIGNYSPEAIGDYIAGPSHTLPTEGTARFSSGLSVFDFLKRISVINCSKESFNKIALDAQEIADAEGLDAHKLSLQIRDD